MTEQDKRGADPAQRKTRVTLGTTSAPLAVLIAWWLKNHLGWAMSEFELIMFSSLCGSVTSVATVCFWDLRGILFSLLYRRRGSDPPRRRLWRRKGGDR